MSGMPSLKILAVNHVDEDPAMDRRITLPPSNVKYIASKDVEVRGRPLKEVAILFVNDNQDILFINISEFELMTLEEVVAGYSFGEY